MVFYLPEESKWMEGTMYSSDLLPRKYCTSKWSVEYVLWDSSRHRYSKHTQQPSVGTVSKCNPIYSVVVVHLFIFGLVMTLIHSQRRGRVHQSECVYISSGCLSFSG